MLALVLAAPFALIVVWITVAHLRAKALRRRHRRPRSA